MLPRTVWITLAGLLAAITALLGWGGNPAGDDPPGTAAALPQRALPPGRNEAAGPAEAPENPIPAIRPRTASPSLAKAFAIEDRPPAAPAPPPPPLTFLGKKLADGQWQIFLSFQDRIYIVQETDAIEHLYRIDAIAPPLMTFTHLPSRQRQTLAIGAPP